MNLQHSNPSTPSFCNLSHETAKIGADNSDNIYLNANIDGRQSYEIYGNVGESNYLSFGLKENRYSKDGTMISLGEIDMRDMTVDASGDFILYLGNQGESKNFLPLPKNANMLIVRQTYENRISQTHAKINIKTTSSQATPELLTPTKLETQLNQSLAFVSGTASTFVKWVHEFKNNHRNQLPMGDQAFFQAAGGDPKICYLHGYYDFCKDEYLEITTNVPDCEYWNFQLENYWMESLDYRHYPIHINKSSAILNSDNTLTINVSHHHINMENNLITEGRNNGAMLLRWIGASTYPIPTVEIKKLDALEVN